MTRGVSILHYTALPVIGGVESVIGDHTRLFTQAGDAVTLIAGRGGHADAHAEPNVVVIPELDSEDPKNREIARALDEGVVPPEFRTLQARIEKKLYRPLAAADVLLVHNVLNFHFNLPLTAALYHLLEQGRTPPLVAWCHDISRYVNASSGEKQRFGFPWDLLRTFRPEIRYVAVSARRQRLLAETLDIVPELIRVIPNGVAPELLLGLGPFGQQVVKEFDLLNADLILLMPVRVTQAKNIEFAMQVTAALKATNLAAKLVITGPPDPHGHDADDYFDELVALRRAMHLEREVIFLYQGTSDAPGPLTLEPATVAELYRVADIVFMPSHREGFGLPVLEGGLAGKAVFATEVPAVDQVGADSVQTIAPDETPDAVAARMRAWAEQELQPRLQRRVRQDYTWQAIFEREIAPLIAECTGSAEE
ncbi:MAG: glycosyltransferase family 4 protein [Chloroflexi bacterium]|nr:glycosyltransferase family 4 protein [Chloroflexota bacterium]